MCLLCVVLLNAVAGEADRGREADYYKLITLPIPEELKLEVSGLVALGAGRLAATIRKGEVWMIDNAYADPPLDVKYTRFASGLHEPLAKRVYFTSNGGSA